LDSPAGKEAESSIGDLFGRRAGKARNGLIALLAGALLIHAALIVFLVGLALALAAYFGPMLGGLIVAAGAGIGGYALIRFGVSGLQALSGDAEEKAALAAGEKSP
jgi:cytochrome c biogenesis protein ResB